MAFKIYYADRTTVKSWELPREFGVPADEGFFPNRNQGFPHSGAVAIVQDDHELGWTFLTGWEYYIWTKSYWIGANYHQLLDVLIEMNLLKLTRRGIVIHHGGKWDPVSDSQFKFFLDSLGIVLTGRMVSAKMQEDILQKAAYDTEFALKRGWSFSEPRISIRAPGVARNYEKNQSV